MEYSWIIVILSTSCSSSTYPNGEGPRCSIRGLIHPRTRDYASKGRPLYNHGQSTSSVPTFIIFASFVSKLQHTTFQMFASSFSQLALVFFYRQACQSCMLFSCFGTVLRTSNYYLRHLIIISAHRPSSTYMRLMATPKVKDSKMMGVQT